MMIKITEENISVHTYQHLRIAAGLSPKSTSAATIGLANTLYSVLVKDKNLPIGMGRLIGDGGCFCQVVDICVLPAYQGKGIGKMVMEKIKHYIDEHLPESCYISLLADGDAGKLYARFGFADAAPQSKGMFLKNSLNSSIQLIQCIYFVAIGKNTLFNIIFKFIKKLLLIINPILRYEEILLLCIVLH